MPDGNISTDPTALRLQLAANGWTPVPITSPDYKHPKVRSPGKQPFIKDWQKLRSENLTPLIIHDWPAFPDQPGTGILTGIGGLMAVDIDVTDPDVATAIRRAAERIMGVTPFVRVGRAPKIILLYRLRTQAKKATTPMLVGTGGGNAQVEVLGLGQQFVAYGIHPVTQKPYEWPERAPADALITEVPETRSVDLVAFLKEAEGILRNAGYTEQRREKAKSADRSKQANKVEPTKQRVSNSKVKFSLPTRDEVADALRAVPNTHDWQGWVKIGAAIFDALGEDGEEFFINWSSQSPKNNHEATIAKWQSFQTSPMTEVTAATLFREARDKGWVPERGRGRRSDAGYAWLKKCHRTRDGYRGTLHNALVALREESRISEVFFYDDMLRMAVMVDPETGTKRPVRDNDIGWLQEYRKRWFQALLLAA